MLFKYSVLLVEKRSLKFENSDSAFLINCSVAYRTNTISLKIYNKHWMISINIIFFLGYHNKPSIITKNLQGGFYYKIV